VAALEPTETIESGSDGGRCEGAARSRSSRRLSDSPLRRLFLGRIRTALPTSKDSKSPSCVCECPRDAQLSPMRPSVTSKPITVPRVRESGILVVNRHQRRSASERFRLPSIIRPPLATTRLWHRRNSSSFYSSSRSETRRREVTCVNTRLASATLPGFTVP